MPAIHEGKSRPFHIQKKKLSAEVTDFGCVANGHTCTAAGAGASGRQGLFFRAIPRV
jgi:hypothetical protein